MIRTRTTIWVPAGAGIRALAFEQLPLDIAAEQFSGGAESYFEHLPLRAIHPVNEYGFAQSVVTSRFGAECGEDEVLRQASVVMAGLEAMGVGVQ